MQSASRQARNALLLQRTFEPIERDCYVDVGGGGGGGGGSGGRVVANMEDMLGLAAVSLGELRRQGETMRRSRHRLYNIAATLGLSKTLVRMVTRRSAQDKLFVVVGMVATLVIMCLVYYFAAFRTQ